MGMSSNVLVPAMALVVAACTGTIGSGADGQYGGPGEPGGTGAAASAQVNPGASPLRRLTNTEYNNTVADLLGDTTAPASAFPAPVTGSDGFDTYASGLGVNGALAQQLLLAAEALATTSVGNLQTLLQCDVNTTGEQDCTQSFVTNFGQRVFRRPLTHAEVERFVQFEATMRSTHSYSASIRLLLEAFLLEPAFLYRVEFGQPGKAGAQVKLTSWEMASRLS